ncbi:N-acetyltransferase [Apiospora hydei]|uniref:N-acetyltransferase n=1 Tax=Apiospora hydei TaxID=1337664 RepID=A0ABR1WZD3_9PEZI
MTVSLEEVVDSNTTARPPHNIKVEIASVKDAKAMADVGARSFDSMAGQSVPDADLEAFMAANYSAAAMAAELQDPDKLTLIARAQDDEAIVGIVQLVRKQTDACLRGDAAEKCCLQRLYVDPRVHGRGVGTRLIGALEEKARTEGFKEIWLTVWEENLQAHRLYERLGYRKAGKTGFWLGTLHQIDWVYLKAL